MLLASTWWLTEVAREHPSQVRLADHAGTDPMMTSQVVRALETRGLLARSGDPADSRARRLAVTTDGRLLAERAVAVVEATDAAFFARAAGRDTILGFLQVLAR